MKSLRPRDVVPAMVGIMAASAGPVRASAEPESSPPAAAQSAERTPERAVDEATTPLPTKTQLAFKPAYTFPNGADRFTADLLFDPAPLSSPPLFCSSRSCPTPGF